MSEFIRKYGALLVIAGSILSSILAALGAAWTVKVTTDPNVSKPEIHIVLPASDSGGDNLPNISQGRGGLHPLFIARVRAGVIKKLMESGEKPRVAIQKAHLVSVEKIATIALTVDPEIMGKIGDGTLVKNLIEWLSDPANQEKLIAIINFIMQLLSTL